MQCFAGSGYCFGIFCAINLAIWALAGFLGVSATSLAMKTFRWELGFQGSSTCACPLTMLPVQWTRRSYLMPWFTRLQLWAPLAANCRLHLSMKPSSEGSSLLSCMHARQYSQHLWACMLCHACPAQWMDCSFTESKAETWNYFGQGQVANNCWYCLLNCHSSDSKVFINLTAKASWWLAGVLCLAYCLFCIAWSAV